MGPTVWELEGPMPILKSSKRLVFTVLIVGAWRVALAGVVDLADFCAVDFFGCFFCACLLLLTGCDRRCLRAPWHDGLVGFGEVDEGHAHAAPASLDGGEDGGVLG